MNDVMEAVNKMNAREEDLRKLFLDLYEYNNTRQDDYKATAILAVDVAIRLANILLSARKQNTGVHRGYMDLIVGLNGNPFWSKFGASLIHLLHSSVQAQADYALLRLEKSQDNKLTHNDELIAECKLVGLEVFTMIAYLLGGHEMMALKSIEIKKRLAPFFMD